MVSLWTLLGTGCGSDMSDVMPFSGRERLCACVVARVVVWARLICLGPGFRWLGCRLYAKELSQANLHASLGSNEVSCAEVLSASSPGIDVKLIGLTFFRSLALLLGELGADNDLKGYKHC